MAEIAEIAGMAEIAGIAIFVIWHSFI